VAEESLSRQVEVVNAALHRLYFTSRQIENVPENLRQINYQDIHVMSVAYDHPDAILKDIRDYMQLPQSTLTSIVNKLERLGVLKRVISHRDLRSYSLELTDLGRTLREKHRESDRAHVARLLESLEPGERQTLADLLWKATSSLK
jgi:DNA-binding MarR family transcriptional regulator